MQCEDVCVCESVCVYLLKLRSDRTTTTTTTTPPTKKTHRHTLKCDTKKNTKKDDGASLEYAIELVN